MINGIKLFELNSKTKLHVVNSNKFKTDLLGIYVKRPLNRDEVTKNTLISRLLSRATKSHQTSQDFNTYLEELYGAILVPDVVKYGDTQVLQLKLQFPNKKRVQYKDIFVDSVKLIDETLNHSYAKDGQFNEEYFLQEKENLRQEIESRTNDKMSYAIDRCIETMFDGENFAIYHYGDVDDLEKITNKELYAHYQEILKTSEIDICFIGGIDSDEVYDAFKNHFTLFQGDMDTWDRQSVHKDIIEVKRVKEEFNVKQGKLTIGYRTNIGFEDDLYYASVIFSYILGGGGSSKLFNVIREEKSLCYYIFSRIDKFQSIMIIGSGIEFENLDTVEKHIYEEIDKMIEGGFEDKEMNIAKDSIVSSIKAISDFPNSFINFYYTQKLSGTAFDLDKVMEKIKNVTKEDIIKAGKMLSLDTIHFLDKQED